MSEILGGRKYAARRTLGSPDVYGSPPRNFRKSYVMIFACYGGLHPWKNAVSPSGVLWVVDEKEHAWLHWKNFGLDSFAESLNVWDRPSF